MPFLRAPLSMQIMPIMFQHQTTYPRILTLNMALLIKFSGLWCTQSIPSTAASPVPKGKLREKNTV